MRYRKSEAEEWARKTYRGLDTSILPCFTPDTLNLIVGERGWRGRHVHSETRVALNDFFFDVVGVEKATATVRADNHPVVINLLRGGWTLEGHLRRHARSPDDGRRVDLYQFGLLREDRHAWKRGRGDLRRC